MATIIVVEPEDRVAGLCKTILNGGGHNVHLAKSGHFALALLDQTNAALMIVSSELESLTEGEVTLYMSVKMLITKVKKMNPSLPVLLMAAGDLPSDSGADRVSTKPFVISKFMEIVEELLLPFPKK